MHLTDVSVGFMPSNAVVGSNIPIAVGAAIGFSIRELDRVAVSFFGDGASNIGAFHEGLNFAAVQNAPVIFVCENNQYAASTHISLAMKIEDIADRAGAYGIPGKSVDGMDVVAVHEVARWAVDRARDGDGPTLLEFKTYRYMGHSRGDPGKYRQQDELDAWRGRDPIPSLRHRISHDFEDIEEGLAAIEASCLAQVEEAVRAAQSAPEPSPEKGLDHVFAPNRSLG
jgi:TPP-dependent pyruvate/acetoin dehydrogenase alpha subunit